MMTIVEALWCRLHTVLTTFAQKLEVVDPTLSRNLGRTANDAFLLRGYLALRRHADGDEVAITVDVQSRGQQLTVESDACIDGGRIIAVGPSAVISLSESQSNIETALNDWLREFERFLLENESSVVLAVSQLL